MKTIIHDNEVSRPESEIRSLENALRRLTEKVEKIEHERDLNRVTFFFISLWIAIVLVLRDLF
jgi:hypothetical protein